jgi:hypothetical protein
VALQIGKSLQLIRRNLFATFAELILSIRCAAGILARGGFLIRRNRRWFVHVLSLALFFAQLGMVVHASTHLDSDPHARPTQSQLCGTCLSFAPMQNMVGGAPIVVLPVCVFNDHALERAQVANVPHRAFTAFRSRAPPVSL